MDTGVSALLKAGVRGLRDDGEVRQAIQQIVGLTGKDPFGRDAERVAEIDLQRLFERYEPGKSNYDQVLEELGAPPRSA